MSANQRAEVLINEKDLNFMRTLNTKELKDYLYISEYYNNPIIKLLVDKHLTPII